MAQGRVPSPNYGWHFFFKDIRNTAKKNKRSLTLKLSFGIMLLLVNRKSSWHIPTDGVKSNYKTVTTSRINNTKGTFERWHLKLCFVKKFIEIGAVYKKLFKRKFAIFDNTTSTKARTHRRLEKKFVVFMVKLLNNQNKQNANGLLAFVLEISMSKMCPVLVGQLPKKMMKFSEKLS